MKGWRYVLIFGLSMLATIALLALWHYLMLGAIGIIAWKILLHRHGRRRGGSFARNVTALAAAYAAWNSRWLKTAKFQTLPVPKSAAPTPTVHEPEWWDDIPY